MKTVLTVFIMMVLPSLSNAYNFLSFKWLEKPGYSYKSENGPLCCISAEEQRNQIIAGREEWPKLQGLSDSQKERMVSVSWDKLGKVVTGITRYDVTLGRTDEIQTDDSRCQKCRKGTFIELISVRIRFNNAINWYKNESSCKQNGIGADLRGTAAHEFGHAIGLDHSEVLDSTMTARAEQCDFSSYPIKQDDIAGHHAIYNNCKEPTNNCIWAILRDESVSSCKDACGNWVNCGGYHKSYGWYGPREAFRKTTVVTFKESFKMPYDKYDAVTKEDGGGKDPDGPAECLPTRTQEHDETVQRKIKIFPYKTYCGKNEFIGRNTCGPGNCDFHYFFSLKTKQVPHECD